MKVWTKRGLIALIALLVTAGGAYAAFHKGAPEAADPPRDVPTFDGQWIRYSDGFATRSGLAFAKVETGSLSPTDNVTGTVTFDPQKVAVIGARMPGRLRTINKFVGDEVKATDVLAELESTELGQAQTSLQSAQAHLAAAKANETREAQLAEARVSAKRDAELAHATAEAAKADFIAAQQRVNALGGGSGGTLGVMRITSPIAGKIIDAPMSRGQSVDASAMLFRVADLSQVWIELAVFERELSTMHPGDRVEITPQGNTSKTLEGRIAHVGDVIDRDTRSGDVRVVVENTERLLRPGQSVLAKIHTLNKPTAGFLLPREALTMVDGKPTVFVVREPGAVEPRTVTIGAEDGVRVEIATGLSAGETVVSKGVFALKSEIFR